jgi:predicted nucleic acid-binding protein
LATGRRVERVDERIKLLIDTWSKSRETVLIPTPVLAEVMMVMGRGRNAILGMLDSAYSFRIEPFDMRAAIETALIADREKFKPRRAGETKAKLRFDRQIAAIAAVNGAKAIYTSDNQLAALARSMGMLAVSVADLPLPLQDPQLRLVLPDASEAGELGDWPAAEPPLA